MIAALFLAAAAAAAADPTYVVERVVRLGGEVRRTSVFRNGVAVVVREKVGEEKRVLRQSLNEIELQVLTQIVDESYPDLTRFGNVGQSPVEGMVDLRLAPLGREPLIVRFPLTGVQVLGAARIGQALDGLEARMTGPGGIREDLRDWQPHVGDWLELEDARVGQVIEVLPVGPGLLVRVEIGTGPASIFVSDGELRRITVRRIKK
ncbi:MAG: hypothetical protein A2Y78_09660 [Acidobacteria bacterium RBG_13_68_16]|nr:MAG: hypothetical protein A2Y78_09660 [Acidobacteria bacterium RBG_13_68_16]